MHFGVVCSEFNQRYTDGLLAAVQKELRDHALNIVRVPGAFEIPIILKRMARTGKYQAVIALGVIWKGQTDHADLIATECARACMNIALETDIPVIYEVLTVRTEAQAKARCLGVKLNRGTEAARTALRMGLIKS